MSNTVYVIQKWDRLDPPDLNATDRYAWRGAWGLKPRTYPKAASNAEAIEIFRKETAKVRTAAYRLVALNGYGYSVSQNVLASHNCGEATQT